MGEDVEQPRSRQLGRPLYLCASLLASDDARRTTGLR